ncbi:DUF4272 domain-containing protein [uncultured Paludibaculum sp.]|uniref:DUF4272 domain-containing protein n=1 Tax=uncultured Paludibaculum sp. TaxID=1765020 RepID=UPI002AAAB7DF|nr:DUF4272 domain-containing protein [uncultured Paludibaculum sp.]
MEFWRRAFWKSFWIALRRCRQDRRARVFVAKVIFAFVYVIGYAGYFLIVPWRQRDGGQALAVYGVLFGTAIIAYFALRRSHEIDQQMLTFSLTGRPEAEPSQPDQTSAAVGLYLAKRAAILSCLIGRAGSEILHKDGKVEGVTRQVQNTWLRENGLWQELEENEGALMSAADATWAGADRDSIVVWCERLRLLRWVLGMDPQLEPLEHFPRPDLRLMQGLHERPEAPQASVMPWDVRVEREKAAAYHARLVAEFQVRKLLPQDPEMEAWSSTLLEQYAGSSTDYLAGTKTIGELEEPELRLLAETVFARVQYAMYLELQLSSDAPISFGSWLEHRAPA